jgi:gliding motility-associated-like protein
MNIFRISSFYICILVFFFCDSNAQLQNHTWLSGTSNLGIHFDNITNVPSVFTGKYSQTGVCGAVVAANPINGNVLFYSDGITAVDKNNQVMPNGSGLLADYATNQSSAICPVPGSCGKYYLFTNSGEATSNPNNGNIQYSIIDMSLPGNGSVVTPLGDVVSGKKNIYVQNNTTEAIAIIPQADYKAYFLLIPQANSDLIKIFKIDNSGVNFYSNFNTGITFTYTGSVKYNLTNKKIVILSYIEDFPILLCDFNDATGVISNVSQMPGTPLGNDASVFYGIHSAEWSPDNSKLYFSKYRFPSPPSGGKIYQYDLNNPLNAPVVVYTVSATDVSSVSKGLKLGPDNKIYFLYNTTTFTDNRIIGVINNPDNAGLSCNPNANGFNFGINGGNTSFFPEFLQLKINAPVALNDFPSCINLNTTTKINVLANDSDPDGDSLLVSVLSVKHGTAQVLSNKQIKYTPASGFSGNDTVQYIITDSTCFPLSDTAFAVVCVNNLTIPCTNHPPSAVNDVLFPCIDLCSNVSINILANDSDPDGDHIYASLIKTLHGSSTISDSTVRYVPDFSYIGADTIYYLLCDSASCSGYCRQAKVILCTSEKELLIPNLFTPNGDHVNDKFEVSGICEGFYIEVYNRWGEMVFKANEYHNNWGGENENDGMYYYMIRDQNRDRRFKGWVNILR